MTKKTKNALGAFGTYSVCTYIILSPLQIWVVAIPISVILGFLFMFLNSIIIELRMLNGEKFPTLEEDEIETKNSNRELLKD